MNLKTNDQVQQACVDIANKLSAPIHTGVDEATLSAILEIRGLYAIRDIKRELNLTATIRYKTEACDSPVTFAGTVTVDGKQLTFSS